MPALSRKSESKIATPLDWEGEFTGVVDDWYAPCEYPVRFLVQKAAPGVTVPSKSFIESAVQLLIE